MNIEKNQIIAGLTAVRARKIVKAVGMFGMQAEKASNAGISDDEITALIEDGWLKMSSQKRETIHLTSNGAQLAAATMLSPLHRGTADRIFSNLVRSAVDYETDYGELNPTCIKAIIGFGSYFAGAERPGDLDIVVILANRPQGEKPICERVEYGERFAPDNATYIERLCWNKIEPVRYVKNGSNRIGNCAVEAFEGFMAAGVDAWVIFDRDMMPSRPQLLEIQQRGFQSDKFKKLTLDMWIQINPEIGINP